MTATIVIWAKPGGSYSAEIRHGDRVVWESAWSSGWRDIAERRAQQRAAELGYGTLPVATLPADC